MKEEHTIVSIQIPDDLKQKITEIAVLEDRTFAAQARLFLKKSIERWNKENEDE